MVGMESQEIKEKLALQETLDPLDPLELMVGFWWHVHVHMYWNRRTCTHNQTIIACSSAEWWTTTTKQKLTCTSIACSGPKGNAGFPGVQGPEGAKGNTGNEGLLGEKGEPGLSGGPGPKGDRGPDGLSGADGPNGEVGPPGEVGETGTVGTKGDQGPRGMFQCLILCRTAPQALLGAPECTKLFKEEVPV